MRTAISLQRHNTTNHINTRIKSRNISTVALAAAAAVPSLLTFFYAALRYRVSQPNEYLVKTGLGISDISVSKKGVQWPLQTYKFVNMNPTNFSFELHAMSTEKMEFVLPGVFTIGPKDNLESITKYSKLLLANESGEISMSHIDTLVKGILEGETRLQSARLTIEEIFNDRKAFKEKLIFNVQEELDQFGMYIYNANIKELQDSEGSEYFAFLRQKKRSEAENRAKVDVAEAQKSGDIGKKEREAITRIQIAQLEAETVLSENLRQQEIEKSKAELVVVQQAAFQKTELARIEAENVSRMREAEMQREVEHKRIAMQTEKLRAVEMSQAQVNAEKEAKDAEGISSAIRLKAEANLFKKQKQAEGILAVYQAQSQGVEKLIASFGGNYQSLIQYLMLDRGLYESLAGTNAQAIQGLNPKITIWNTSNEGKATDSNGPSYTKPIAEIMKSIPPLLTTIHEQTGIQPPEWLAQLPKEGKEGEVK